MPEIAGPQNVTFQYRLPLPDGNGMGVGLTRTIQMDLGASPTDTHVEDDYKSTDASVTTGAWDVPVSTGERQLASGVESALDGANWLSAGQKPGILDHGVPSNSVQVQWNDPASSGARILDVPLSGGSDAQNAIVSALQSYVTSVGIPAEPRL